MIEVGRVVVKIAGRDAGKKGVILQIIDSNYVLIDGEVRRRKVNVKHIEPLDQKINIKENASHEEVVKAFSKELGIEIKEKKGNKEKKEKGPRPKKQRKKKESGGSSKKEEKKQ